MVAASVKAAGKVKVNLQEEKPKKSGFRRELNTWELTMLTLGGMLGSGIFLASGTAISHGGPGVLISYVLGFLLMAFEITALVEMTVADPVPGSFYVYTNQALGPRWGFTMGWVFWFSSLTTMSTEVTAASLLSRYWFSGVPLWSFSLGYSVLVILINLLSVKGYGEIQKWFSTVKVAAIGIFLCLGAAFLLLPHAATPWQGGFLPHGWGGVAGAMLLVMYGFACTGSISLAAAETAFPRRTIPKALTAVIIVIGILFLGSALVLTRIIPWNQVPTHQSPFVFALHRMGLPYAGSILNFVIITAVLSSMNAALYGVGRMLYSLGNNRQAPSWFAVLNGRGIPERAILASSVVLILGVILAYFLPQKLYVYLSSGTGFMAMLIWTFVILSQIYYRKKIRERLVIRAPGYPYLSWIALVVLGGIVVAGLTVPDEAIGLEGGLIASLLILLAYSLFISPRSKNRPKGRPSP